MPKKLRSELEAVKNFVDKTYSRFGNILLVDTSKVYDPEHSELGYCYKYVDPVNGHVTYRIICSTLGIERTDFRVMMHEYGHIYLTHLDGIHEELDIQICNLFKDHRGELIEHINKSCGIDFADKLIERVIDDPELNHSLHNIAMDMQVNSSILSKDDIEEMETDISSVFPKTEEELLQQLIDKSPTPEEKEMYQKELDRMQKEAKIKLIIPERYKLGVDDEGNPIPFPDDLTYAEYLMLIVEHLDQFVKMLVSIQMGGNGDTSNVTMQDIQDVLNNMWNNQSDEYKRGYQDAINDYNNNQLGQQQGNPQNQQNQQGQPGDGQGQPQNGQGNQGQPQAGNGSNPGQGQPIDGNGSGDPCNSGAGSQSGSGQTGSGNQGNQPGNQGQPGPGQGNGQPQAGNHGGQSDYERGYQDALRDILNGHNSQGGGMQGLSNLLEQMGISGENKYKGVRPDSGSQNDGGARKDHGSDSRDEADKKREVGQISSKATVGCGSNGGPDAIREVSKNVDPVDIALKEVLQHIRSRVVKQDTRKDVMKLYNRGVVRSVIAPSVSRKVTISNEPKLVYLIDISGSMDTRLVDRILKSIALGMKKLSRGLKYDIITWSTCLGEHIKDIDPNKSIPKISMGGGTRMARGIEYFKNNYGPEATLIVISDFEDYLEEWNKVESEMPNYTMYGFNYGRNNSDSINWKYMKIKKFNS